MVPRERKIETSAGEWYLMKILPCRTTENVVNGLVYTFLDISGVIRAARLGDYLQNIFNTLSEPIDVLDKNHTILSLYSAFVKWSRVAQSKRINVSLYAIREGAWNITELKDALQKLSATGRAFYGLLTEVATGESESMLVDVSGCLLPSLGETSGMILVTLKC